jgi:hypothetical protein
MVSVTVGAQGGRGPVECPYAIVLGFSVDETAFNHSTTTGNVICLNPRNGRCVGPHLLQIPLR